jgi:hypothetical protein
MSRVECHQSNKRSKLLMLTPTPTRVIQPAHLLYLLIEKQHCVAVNC